MAICWGAIITVALLFINLRIKIGPFGGRHVLSVFLKAVISALLMALVTYFSYKNIAYS